MSKVTKTVVSCDVCKSDHCVIEDYKTVVIFLTEQTEGRSVAPYFEHCKLDLCESCIDKMLKNGVYIKASGAMGYNRYNLGKGGK